MLKMLRKPFSSLTLYPITTVYVAGVTVAVGIGLSWFDINAGLIALTAISLTVVLIALTREVRIVHHLVNAQRDALLLRIDDLVDSLNEAGVALPLREQGKSLDV